MQNPHVPSGCKCNHSGSSQSLPDSTAAPEPQPSATGPKHSLQILFQAHVRLRFLPTPQILLGQFLCQVYSPPTSPLKPSLVLEVRFHCRLSREATLTPGSSLLCVYSPTAWHTEGMNHILPGGLDICVPVLSPPQH